MHLFMLCLGCPLQESIYINLHLFLFQMSFRVQSSQGMSITSLVSTEDTSAAIALSLILS